MIQQKFQQPNFLAGTFQLCYRTFETENETESLLIPAVQHDKHHRINVKNNIDLRLT